MKTFLMGMMGLCEDLSGLSLCRGWRGLNALRMRSLREGGLKSRGVTLLNCDQDTERCWKASMLRLLSLKIFWARKRKCSGSSPRLVPTSAMNLRFRVSHIFSQGTRSATTKGTRSWEKERAPQASVSSVDLILSVFLICPSQHCFLSDSQTRCFHCHSLSCYSMTVVRLG